MNDEQQIRGLIEGWAEAVHRGDLERVLADHADDLVMFDVPPPYQGIRGLAATRRSGRRSSPGRPTAPRSRSSRWR